MKVTVRNLGIIKDEATIDLKPLTIFIGPNNSGKTWLAYAIAGILGAHGTNEYIQAYINEKVPQLYKPLNEAVEKVLSDGSATIDLYRFMEEYGEVYFNEVAKYAHNWINQFLGTEYAHFDKVSVSFELAETKAYLLQRVLRLQRTINVAKGLLTIQKNRNDGRIYAYTVVEGQSSEIQKEEIGAKIPLKEVRRRLINFSLTALQQTLYTQARILPTERSTLVTTHFGWRISGPTTNDTIQPVESFVSMLSELFVIGIREKEIRQKIVQNPQNDPRFRQYVAFADMLEKHLLLGNIEFSTLEPDATREVLFQSVEGVNLEISIASSMVKELAPLILYLRYLAQPGDLVVIDEPEMNLHPEAQAKIIEFLAMLVNTGLNVLITTHSPYITDHLTNLIKASEREDKESIKQAFFLQRTEAFIDKEKVSVYGFSDGKVDNVLDEDGIVNWNTFGDVSEKIADIFMKL